MGTAGGTLLVTSIALGANLVIATIAVRAVVTANAERKRVAERELAQLQLVWVRAIAQTLMTMESPFVVLSPAERGALLTELSSVPPEMLPTTRGWLQLGSRAPEREARYEEAVDELRVVIGDLSRAATSH